MEGNLQKLSLIFFLTRGIKRQLSAPYSAKQNGVVESKNKTILNMVRSMLAENNLPHAFWG